MDYPTEPDLHRLLSRKAPAAMLLLLLFASAVPVHADEISTRLDSGLDYYQRGDYERALSIFTDATASFPDSRDAWTYKGATLAALGRDAEAVVAYDNALKIDPTNTDILYYKGLSLNKLQKYEEARTVFSEVQALDPASEIPISTTRADLMKQIPLIILIAGLAGVGIHFWWAQVRPKD